MVETKDRRHIIQALSGCNAKTQRVLISEAFRTRRRDLTE